MTNVDGRRVRAERNRDAVVSAMLALLEEGMVEPGAARVAERAGVSERSVYRHFDDLEGLASAAIERRWSQVGAVFEPPDASGTRDQRIHALVEQRLRMYERVMPVGRAALVLAARSVTVAAAIEVRRALLRTQVETQFAPELAGLPRGERSELLSLLDLAVSLDALEYLRTNSGLSRPATKRALTRSLDALLAPAIIATTTAAPEHA